MVLVTFPEGPPTKQSPRWKGPWKISKIVSPWRSEIVNLDGHDAEIVGNDRLRTVVLREQEGELLKVQSRDNDEWEVDRIVSHMYGSKKPIRFKVKWKGFEDKENSYITWKEAKKLSEAMEDYLRRNPNLKKK
ncbi:hypothetical protein ADUPG1_002965 [Aduncisulcus paluster]|uniref:Chromo domain-containing protein n=1 Tax=Aduncisulcus paluster TaxID=2918883 RepID=A0ABQ5KS65_9EUKA|nr:hypothetical protein ADUPG1_002965 [Aduncisulcus paluster]